VHQPPLVWGDRVIFVTVTPNTNPCLAGGSNWAMEVETKDGSALEQISPFDFPDNQSFDILSLDPDEGDDEPATYFGAGIRIPNSGVYSAPTALVVSGKEEREYISTSRGQMIDLAETTGLNLVRPWREIR
jgi:type IV pilus assembly protein PilY1